MGKECCVLGCRVRRIDQKTDSQVSFHKFPANNPDREAWFAKLREVNNPMLDYADPLFVCSNHFEKSCFNTVNSKCIRILPGSVPTILPSPYKHQNQSAKDNVFWPTQYGEDVIIIESNCEDNEDEMMLLCRFCLLKKPRMERLEWSKWPTASISKLFQQVVGEALIVSDKISEYWCTDCHCEMQRILTDILRWKNANKFWQSHWYKKVQIEADLKIEILEKDREIKEEPMEMLVLEEYEAYNDPTISRVNHESDDDKVSADFKSIHTTQHEETGYHDEGNNENDMKIEEVDREQVALKISSTLDEPSKKMVSPKVPAARKRKPKNTKSKKPAMVEILTDKTFDCSLCSKSFNFRSLLKEHRDEEHNDPASLTCDLCARQCPTKYSLSKHRKSVHSSNEYKYKCDYPGCSKVFRRSDCLRFHMKRHGEKTLICDKCQMSFHLKKDMVTHWHNVHLKLRPVICEFCGHGFINSYVMRRTHTPEQCRSRSWPNRSLKQPRRPQALVKLRSPLKCRACAHECHLPETLEKHYNQEHPGWNVADEIGKICIKCYAQFETAEERAEHQDKVHNQWQCPICKMSLKCKESFDRHVLRHPMDKERPFRCEVCGSQHMTLTHMKNHHRRAHTNIRPHECDICHRRFAELPEMRTHRKLHTQLRVACPECGKLCANAKVARDHYRMEHSKDFVFFTCEFCDEKFRSSTTMHWHARSHHPNQFQQGGLVK